METTIIITYDDPIIIPSRSMKIFLTNVDPSKEPVMNIVSRNMPQSMDGASSVISSLWESITHSVTDFSTADATTLD